jgi:hypothetical protein
MKEQKLCASLDVEAGAMLPFPKKSVKEEIKSKREMKL